MTIKSKLLFATIFATLIILAGCDPGHFGKALIINDSSYTLALKYQTQVKDTSVVIQPNSQSDVFHFGGLGSGRDYVWCVYEFRTISLQPIDTSKYMIKTITDCNNWTTSNPNTRQLSNKEINCAFLVTQTDIQWCVRAIFFAGKIGSTYADYGKRKHEHLQHFHKRQCFASQNQFCSYSNTHPSNSVLC